MMCVRGAVLITRGLEDSKRRLAPLLAPERRRGITRAMLLDVVEAVLESRSFDRIVLVSEDEEAISMARKEGIQAVREPDARGMSVAFTRGLDALPERLDVAALFPCDLPLLKPEDVAFLVGRTHRGPRTVIVPSPTSQGTSILMSNPGRLIPLHFEEDSYRLHYKVAREVGEVEVYWLEAGLDVDETQDLIQVLGSHRRCRTRDLLRSWRLMERLRVEGGV